jgi:hypothetical protein
VWSLRPWALELLRRALKLLVLLWLVLILLLLAITSSGLLEGTELPAVR